MRPCKHLTRKLNQCSLEKVAFVTGCHCLANNTECGPACGCEGRPCLNRAIGLRRQLRPGTDLNEADVWGFDCYTRRNIHDGALLL